MPSSESIPSQISNLSTSVSAKALPEVTLQITAVLAADAAWRAYVGQYIGAYDVALHAYKDVLDAQQKADQANRELAFTALAIAGGNGLVAVFAKALRSKMGDAALNLVTKYKLEKGFMVLYHGQSNAVAKFALDNAWTIATSAATDALKKQWVTQAESRVSGPQGPFSLSAEMGRFYARIYEGLMDWLFTVCESTSISDEMKIEILRSVKKAPFVSRAPRSVAFDGKLSAKLLLGFYMKFLLDQDFEEVCRPEFLKYGAGVYAAACRTHRIAALPSQRTGRLTSAYPTTGVHYKPLGAKIREGIDRAYGAVYGGDHRFFGAPTQLASLVEGTLGRQLTFELLKKAERTLERLSVSS